MPSTLGIVSSHSTRPIVPVSLLLQGNETPIRDSLNKNSVTAYGNATISTSVKKYGNGSLYFDGNGDYLTVPATSDFAFGTKDFTVELWYYPLANKSYPTALEVGNHLLASSCGFFLQDGGSLTPMVYSGAFVRPTNRPNITLNQWNHVVWQRTSGKLRIFVNGVGSDTITFTNNITLPSQVSIGYAAGYLGSSGYYCIGYIDDLRISKGALYTENFAPGPLSELPTTDPINLNL